MERLIDIAKKRLNQHRLGESAQAADVLFAAAAFLKNRFSIETDSVRPVQLSNTILWLSVKHAGWAQEVHGIADELLTQLQSRYGKKIITGIRTKYLTSA
ncbi:hypothetical protein COY07_01980 [Candidatus Peregrinibacteria bacterium CG_4_10_14_0_2_um_filter_43_11]|nr:MAG: hypothetical protein COY07_01980 [Candidatus Peregrinibacteria bacterium CG_4_10_14_0_2_um_filter_43_11]